MSIQEENLLCRTEKKTPAENENDGNEWRDFLHSSFFTSGVTKLPWRGIVSPNNFKYREAKIPPIFLSHFFYDFRSTAVMPSLEEEASRGESTPSICGEDILSANISTYSL